MHLNFNLWTCLFSSDKVIYPNLLKHPKKNYSLNHFGYRNLILMEFGMNKLKDLKDQVIKKLSTSWINELFYQVLKLKSLTSQKIWVLLWNYIFQSHYKHFFHQTFEIFKILKISVWTLYTALSQKINS